MPRIPHEYNHLPRKFYERGPLMVSRDLLGKLLVRETKQGKIIGEIVETEVYIGPHDKASHSYNHRKTRRTIVQFGERGHAYVYRIYGIHYCFCIVVGPPYIPAVTLVRAIKPVKGINAMRQNRGVNGDTPMYRLTNGPSKVCQAFKITSELNGADMLSEELSICQGGKLAAEIISSSRIGIDYAEEYKNVPWRFYVKDNKFLSKPH